MFNLYTITDFVKKAALEIGFDYCGIAKAEPLDEDAKRLETWLNKGFQGNMHYMEKHFEERINPQKLVPSAKSVITLLKSYAAPNLPFKSTYKISKYAWGKDYHFVIRSQLNSFLNQLETKIGKIEGRGFVDSAPVLERAWAVRSGLGWIGKNGNLLTKKSGSFYFIAVLIIDKALHYDTPFVTDHCGSCTRCIDACPTQAILPNKQINGSQCIAYYTIELKEMLIPHTHNEKWGNWMFGCDICQEVCPWNRFSLAHKEPNFFPSNELLEMTNADWENLEKKTFQKIFKTSPLLRTKYGGIKRNIQFLSNKKDLMAV